LLLGSIPNISTILEIIKLAKQISINKHFVMKKFILIFVMLFSICAVYAQDKSVFKAYELAIKIEGEWSDWQPVNIPVVIDYEQDIIIIYSAKTQKYLIIEETAATPDSNGKQVAFKVIDQDGDVGRFRFRVQNNGTKQIYVDFNDISWCYNVK